MNEQVRSAILAALAALAGWSGITTVGLLIQVSSLQTTADNLKQEVRVNSERDQRLEDKIYGELKAIRELIEARHGIK